MWESQSVLVGEEKLSCNQEVFPVNCIKEPHGGKGTGNSKYFSIGEDFLSHSKYIFTFTSNFYICNFIFFVLKRIPKLYGTGPCKTWTHPCQ